MPDPPDTRFKQITRLVFPTLFIWLVTFEWISRASPGIQITVRILFVLLGCLWLVLRGRDSQPLRLTSVGFLLLLYILYAALLIPGAPLPFHALEVETSYIFYFAVFIFYLNELHSKAQRDAWHFAFIQTAILFSAFNILLVGRWWSKWISINGLSLNLPPFGYRLPGLFLQHPNVEAAYLNLVIPFLFVGLLQSRSIRKTAGALGLMALLLISSFFASSRGAWLGMASSIGVASLLVYWEQFGRIFRQLLDRQRIRISPRTLVLILLGISAAGGIGFLSFQQARFGGHGGRWGLWAVAWEIIKQSPVIGHGPGSMHILSAVQAAIPPGFYLVHAHNLALQIMSESGIIGFLLFSLIFLRISWIILQLWADQQRASQELIPYIAALAGMLTHQVVDFAFEAPLYTVGVLFGLAQISRAENARSFFIKQKVWKVCTLCILVAAFAAGSYYLLRGAPQGVQGVNSAQGGDWQRAQSQFCNARIQNPQNSLYSFQCAFASAVSASLNDETKYLDFASRAYQEGLNLDPYWAFHQAASASLSWMEGNSTVALEQMQNAQEQAPASAIIALNLAYYHAELGNPDQAQDSLALAYQLDPWLWLSGSDLWKPPGKALDQELSTTLPPSIISAWEGWVYLELENWPEAKQAFLFSLQLDPACVEARAGLAKLAMLNAEWEQALYQLEVADLSGRESWLVQAVRGDLFAASGDMNSAYKHWLDAAKYWFWTTQSNPYSESVYSRAYIPIDLPPQVLQPGLPQLVKEGFERAQSEGPEQIQAEARKLLPWLERQIHLVTPDPSWEE